MKGADASGAVFCSSFAPIVTGEVLAFRSNFQTSDFRGRLSYSRMNEHSKAMDRLNDILKTRAALTDPVARMLAVSPRLVGMPRPILVEPPDANEATHREPSVDEEQPFYEALGRAVAMWQFVETSLVLVQQAADRSAERRKNAVWFHKEQKFTLRLPLVAAALAKVELLKFWADQWPAFHSKLRAASSVRNRISHALVYFDPRRTAGSRIFLSVNLRNPDRWDEFMRGEKHFDTAALLATAARFCHLYDEVRNFAQLVNEDHDRLRLAYPQAFAADHGPSRPARPGT